MNKNKDKNKNMVNKIIPAALASAAAAPGSPRSSSWLSRPRRALCIILGLCAASFFIIDIREINPPDRGGADETFTLTQRFYGVDAAEMERIAAIPLEDALSGIRGLKRVVSVSENGRARVVCWFEGRERGRYEAVREAAQRVYEALPPAAQRPEISTAGGSRVPVWTAAFTALDGAAGTVLEKAVKPALEGIPGAGDVEISGAGRKETALVLDHGETAARSLDAGTVAAVLGSNDTLLPGGSIRLDGRDIPVMVDGRYDGIEDMRGAIIPLANAQGGGGFVRLGDIAAVGEQERNHESRSRLNGKNIALAAVFAGDGADLGKLSAAIGEELAKFPALEYTVLSDRGEAERRARSSALGAALQGACAVALLSALISARGSSLKRNLSLALNCALTVPAVIFFSAALLVLWGFALDKLVLAGLSAGVGAAVDAAILCAEYLRSCKTREEGKAALESLRFPLASGAVTTVIALLPLMARREGGMASVAWAVAAVNLTAMVLALTLLPPLFFWGRFDGKGAPLREAAVSTGVSARTKGVSAGTKAAAAAVFCRLRFFSALNPARRCRRFLAAAVVPLGRKKTAAAAAGLWFLLGALGIGALLVSGADVEQDYSEDSVYAQVEFDGGLHMEETDGRLVPYGELLKDHPGIKSVQTVARTGTGSVLVSFDPRLMEGRAVRTLMKDSPVEGGFVYFLESSGRDRSWRLRVSGDEPERCQKAAEEAARICAALPEVTETVLNFKEGGPRLDIIPDRRKLVQAGLSFGVLGRTVRRSVHGPVAYKRIGEEGETDVRIRGGTEAPGREEVLGIPLMGASPVILSRTVLAEDSREPSSIQREDRRRGASITIRTAAADPRRIRDRVMAALANLELPPGYAVSFDPPAIRAAEEAGGQGALFLLALLFCYLVIAAFKESFTFPLAALAVVPPSLAVPALVMVLWGRPLNAVSAAAFVAVSGIAVNAAVLAADALQRAGAGGVSFYRVLREKAPVLAATAGTTVAGALPFLFIGSGAAGVIKTLSLVSALGVAASAFCALTLIPALVTLFPGILLPWKRSFV